MNYTEILNRAQDRQKEIKYSISSMENEYKLLEMIVAATQIPSPAQIEALFSQYRMLYKKK